MTHFRLAEQLERDIRNQVLIDRMRTVTPRDRLMLHLRDHGRTYTLCALFYGTLAIACAVAAHAEPASPSATPVAAQCPVPGEKCKVLYLNESEEAALMKQNGILDTAAQARNLDLGGVAVYFKTKIGSAPQGEVIPVAPKADDKK